VFTVRGPACRLRHVGPSLLGLRALLGDTSTVEGRTMMANTWRITGEMRVAFAWGVCVMAVIVMALWVAYEYGRKR
jgi:hypothetical protein